MYVCVHKHKHTHIYTETRLTVQIMDNFKYKGFFLQVLAQSITSSCLIRNPVVGCPKGNGVKKSLASERL